MRIEEKKRKKKVKKNYRQHRKKGYHSQYQPSKMNIITQTIESQRNAIIIMLNIYKYTLNISIKTLF